MVHNIELGNTVESNTSADLPRGWEMSLNDDSLIRKCKRIMYSDAKVSLATFLDASSFAHYIRRYPLRTKRNLNEESFSERWQGIKMRRRKNRERLKDLNASGPCSCEKEPIKPVTRSGSNIVHQESHLGEKLSVQDDCTEGSFYMTEESIIKNRDYKRRKSRTNGSSMTMEPLQCITKLKKWNQEKGLDEVVYLRRYHFMRKRDVAVLIPKRNKLNYLPDDFSFFPMRGVGRIPQCPNAPLVSPVISIGPNAAEFYNDQPVFICLPVPENICVGRVRCFCSCTSVNDIPKWEEIPSSDFEQNLGCVIIKTWHLSLYAVVLDIPPSVVSEMVIPEIESVIEVEQVPGVKIVFPKGSVDKPMLATVKVHSKKLSKEKRRNLSPHDALASPVVILGPHGYIFEKNTKKPVHIHLPIPNYLKIKREFGAEAELSVWHSPTQEEDPVDWQPLDVEYTLYYNEKDEYFIEIPIYHFSWLTALWSSIRSRMTFSDSAEAVPMKCQAWMLENENSNKFGLVVMFHNAENSMQEMGNYSLNVGGSIQPVTVSPDGDIVVKLSKSKYYEADTEVDEDETLEKVKANYNGRDFDMQFACKFKGEGKPTKRDIFGKVYVKKRKGDGTEEKLFQFNLIKKGDVTEEEQTDPWATTSLKELAEIHLITSGNNWRRLAAALGFTDEDMKSLSRLSDPFSEIISRYRRRGGSIDEFMTKFYSVAQEIKLDPSDLEKSEEGGGSARRGWFWPSFSWGHNLGSTGSGSRASSSTRGGDRSDDEENRPSTSGLSISRKRVLPTTESGTSASSSSKRRRTRAAAQQEAHEQLEQLQISPENSTTGSSTSHHGLLGTPYKGSPPHNSLAGPSNTTLVQSGSGGGIMSTITSVFRPNPPMTEFLAGAVPSSSLSALPSGNSQRRLDEEFQRSDSTEILQSQLYRIAPHIQSHWVKVARLVRDDDNVEADIRIIMEQYPNPEEQAIQMLLQWREKCPDVCTRGRLYGALCDLNFKTIAKKCNQIYLRR